jgi:hypothetical protein
MKNKINKFLLVLFLVICPVIISLAQGPPVPHDAPDPLGSPGTPTPMSSTGGSAPIPDGFFILMGLATIYGAYKYFQVRKQVKTT